MVKAFNQRNTPIYYQFKKEKYIQYRGVGLTSSGGFVSRK